jgi:hypothetical protein
MSQASPLGIDRRDGPRRWTELVAIAGSDSPAALAQTGPLEAPSTDAVGTGSARL